MLELLISQDNSEMSIHNSQFPCGPTPKTKQNRTLSDKDYL